MIKETALEYFKNNYSCSESIIKACIEEGLCSPELLPCASTFSSGMSSGCVCGTVAASQIVWATIWSENRFGNDVSAREKAAQMVEEFKNKNKLTCCRVLSAGLAGSEKKPLCAKFVADACDILEELIKVKV